MTLSAPEDRLRAAGLRVTATRVAVLATLAEDAHRDVDSIVAAVRSRLGAVSTQGVYDVLRTLCDAGLARRIEPAGSPARFEARVGDNHHHIVCRHCGAVTDVDCVVGERPCLDPSATHGFVLDEAEVTFWGLCPQCQASAPASAAPSPATATATAIPSPASALDSRSTP